MHVLIFTGQFGMGHIAAAQAVQEEILRQEPTASVTVLDIVEDCFPQLHRLVYGCFDFTVNYCSGVYNMLNRMAGRYRCTPMKRTMVQKLDQLLYESQADLVISTLPLSSQYISAYKRQWNSCAAGISVSVSCILLSQGSAGDGRWIGTDPPGGRTALRTGRGL